MQITAPDVLAAREALLRLASAAQQFASLSVAGAVGISTSHVVSRINEELDAAGGAWLCGLLA